MPYVQAISLATTHLSWLACIVLSFCSFGAQAVVKSTDNRVAITYSTEYVNISIGKVRALYRGSLDANACTGTIISRRHILTAAHCLFDEYGNLYDQIEFLPIPFAGRSNIPRDVIRKAWVVKSFPQLAKDRARTRYVKRNSSYRLNDYAVLESSYDIGAGLEISEFKFSPRRIGREIQSQLWSYPSDKPRLTLWREECSSSLMENELQFDVNCSTQKGVSGAGLFLYDQINGKFFLEGIMTSSTINSNRNIALRLRPEIASTIENLTKGIAPEGMLEIDFSDEPVYMVSFRNQCNLDAWIAVKGNQTNNKSDAIGWYVLSPHERKILLQIEDREYFLSVTDEKGNPIILGAEKFKVRGKDFGFERYVLPEGKSHYVHNVGCNS